MTVQAFKFKKSHLFAIIMSAIIIVGILCFVLAMGLSKGWDWFGRWLSSDSAVLLYIIVGLYFLGIGIYFINEKVKNI